MASTTAEVMLYFDSDSKLLEDAVTSLRFSQEPPLSSHEIIKILGPAYTEGYDQGYNMGYEDGREA